MRVDDTGLLMFEIMIHGFEHDRGRAALRRMNQIHRRYAIANDEYLYVLGHAKVPRPLAPLGDALVAALYDHRLRDAVQVRRAPWPARVILHFGLRGRAVYLPWVRAPSRLSRSLRANAESLSRTASPPAPTPHGYEIERLGP